MSNTPFRAEQFTTTPWDTAQEKAKWANAMASWILRGFPLDGWRKGLYIPLHTHMYDHIAHYNRYGFYDEWFDGIHRQLEWFKYTLKGGWGGFGGSPAHSWCDVEQAFSTWIREQGLVEQYQQRCAADIEARERAQLTALLQKYYPGAELERILHQSH